MKYNGFTNVLTWAVMSTIDNNRAEYDHWHEIAEDLLTETKNRKDAVRRLADEIKDHFAWSMNREDDVLTGELIRAAASEINYTEIADSIIDDIE